jgi:hypothetical protein
VVIAEIDDSTGDDLVGLRPGGVGSRWCKGKRLRRWGTLFGGATVLPRGFHMSHGRGDLLGEMLADPSRARVGREVGPGSEVAGLDCRDPSGGDRVASARMEVGGKVGHSGLGVGRVRTVQDRLALWLEEGDMPETVATPGTLKEGGFDE